MIDLQNVLKNGGASVNLKGETLDFANGYCVSMPAFEVQKSVEGLTQVEVNTMADEIAFIIRAGNMTKTHFIGCWIENDVLFMDVSTHIFNRYDAIEFGKIGKQLAIWDCAAQDEIILADV